MNGKKCVTSGLVDFPPSDFHPEAWAFKPTYSTANLFRPGRNAEIFFDMMRMLDLQNYVCPQLASENVHG